MKNIGYFLCMFLLFSAHYSCNSPQCRNTNPVFENNPPESETYKLELIKQMVRVPSDKFIYWLDGYYEENGKEYLVVNIQGGPLCAKGIMRVDAWGKASGIKKTKGVGYRGAQLAGLTFTIQSDSLGTEFIYHDIDRIID
jgi:hypothetical protein